ncbi:hypothetical protein Moror_3551 [Moniliophthora roreri MCA 2997]|uniref:Uncharacterized protein n=2 Tax=Moniliophthora roreri TaxID=221103 RepID=V2WLE4_MONRO|nr:hypothetical protein Moror_3551 [Moniliophthora roreri MCA 2997]
MEGERQRQGISTTAISLDHAQPTELATYPFPARSLHVDTHSQPLRTQRTTNAPSLTFQRLQGARGLVLGTKVVSIALDDTTMLFPNVENPRFSNLGLSGAGVTFERMSIYEPEDGWKEAEEGGRIAVEQEARYRDPSSIVSSAYAIRRRCRNL